MPLHRCTSSCLFIPLHTSSYLFIYLFIPLHKPLQPLHTSSYTSSFLVIAKTSRESRLECHIKKRELTHLCHYTCRNRSVAGRDEICKTERRTSSFSGLSCAASPPVVGVSRLAQIFFTQAKQPSS